MVNKVNADTTSDAADDTVPSHQELWTPADRREDPVTVRLRLKLALARLNRLREHIHGDDKALLKMADAHHDHHGALAEQAASDIRASGVGNDPTLENVHFHHLSEKRDAEQTAIKLRARTRDYQPKIPRRR